MTGFKSRERADAFYNLSARKKTDASCASPYKTETIIDRSVAFLARTPAGLAQPSSISRSVPFICLAFILAEIPRVVQTQGTAGEESGEHEDDDEERGGYDGRAGK